MKMKFTLRILAFFWISFFQKNLTKLTIKYDGSLLILEVFVYKAVLPRFSDCFSICSVNPALIPWSKKLTSFFFFSLKKKNEICSGIKNKNKKIKIKKSPWLIWQAILVLVSVVIFGGSLGSSSHVHLH